MAGQLLSPLRRHWRVALYNGLIFGWWQAGPLGPLYDTLSRGADPVVIAGTLAGTVTGLVLGGLLWDWRPDWKLTGSTASLLAVVALHNLLPDLPRSWWGGWMMLMGLALGVWVPLWGCAFVQMVPAGERGRVFGWAALTSHLVAQVFFWLLPWLPARLLWGGLSALLAITAILPMRSGPRTQTPGRSPRDSLVALRQSIGPWWRLVLFAALAHLLSAPFWELAQAQVVVDPDGHRLALALARVIGAMTAGVLADRYGRLPVAATSVLTLGVSVALGLLPPGPFRQPLQNAAALAGVFMLIVFWWTSLADLAYSSHPSTVYGIGQGAAALASAAGTFLPRYPTGAYGLTLLILIAAVGLLWRQRELSLAPGLIPSPELAGPELGAPELSRPVSPWPEQQPGRWAWPELLDSAAPQEPPAAGAPVEETEVPGESGVPEGLADTAPDYLTEALQEQARVPLTSREADVAPLLIRGLPLDEIAAELYITRNTVRTHVRNIYRKTGTRNRRDLLSRLLQRVAKGESDSPG